MVFIFIFFFMHSLSATTPDSLDTSMSLSISIEDYFKRIELNEQEEKARDAIYDEAAMLTSDILNNFIHEHFTHLIIEPYFPRAHQHQDVVNILSHTFYLHSILSFRLGMPNNTSFFTFAASEISKNKHSITQKIQSMYQYHCILYNIIFNKDAYPLPSSITSAPLITVFFNKTLFHHACMQKDLPIHTKQWFIMQLDNVLNSGEESIRQHYLLFYKNRHHYKQNTTLFAYYRSIEHHYRHFHHTDLINRHYNIYLPHVLHTHKEHNGVTLQPPGSVLAHYKKFHSDRLNQTEHVDCVQEDELSVEDQIAITVSNGLDFMHTSRSDSNEDDLEEEDMERGIMFQ